MAGVCNQCFDRRARRLPLMADGLTPLSKAAGKGHETCVATLLKAGGDVNTANNKGDTALMHACKNGHDKCAQLLIKAGAYVNIVNKTGSVPLNNAAENGF